MVAGGRIDVVIPVYQAPELTRVCIESLFAHAGERVGDVLVHDNASGEETRRMLDSLRLPRLRVHHAETNTGFGDAVNQGMHRARSEYVLVLNSDVRADDDFLTPLAESLREHPELVALTPSGNTFSGYPLDRYVRRGSCVVTHSLYAYAFLVRREAFLEIGGFDPDFGLGFYEDSDLSRRFIAGGLWLGVHTQSTLWHAIHGSFEGLHGYRELMARNRRLYYERYPKARRRVLLVSGCALGSSLPPRVVEELRSVLEAGGDVHWAASDVPHEMLSLGMRGERFGASQTASLLLRKRRKTFGRFTDLWMLDDTPASARILPPLARALGLRREPWRDPAPSGKARGRAPLESQSR